MIWREVPTGLWMAVCRAVVAVRTMAPFQPAAPHVYTEFDAWVMQFALFVQHKGKVEPGQCRAYGYEAPSHR